MEPMIPTNHVTTTPPITWFSLNHLSYLYENVVGIVKHTPRTSYEGQLAPEGSAIYIVCQGMLMNIIITPTMNLTISLNKIAVPVREEYRDISSHANECQ